MKINKLNYETYIIDYLENQLSALEREEFEKYIQMHPEVKAEIDDYLKAPILTEDVSVIYNNKESDKRRRSGFFWLIGGLFLLLTVTLVLFKLWAKDSSLPKEMTEEKKFKSEIESLIETKKSTTVPVAQIEDKEEKASYLKRKIADENLVPVIAEAKIKVTKNLDLIVEEAIPDDNKLNENYVHVSATSIKESANTIATNEKIVKPMMPLKEEIIAMPVIPARSQKDGFNRSRLIEMVVVKKKIIKKKNSGLRKMFVPQSYENIDLKEAVVSINLKSAARDIEKTLVPDQIMNY